MSYSWALDLPGAPKAFAAAFEDSVFGLVGFTDAYSEAIGAALAKVGGTARPIGVRSGPGGAQFNGLSGILLCVSPDLRESPWSDPETVRSVSVPLIAVGSYQDLFESSAIQLPASDILLRPFSDEELTFRIWRCLGRPRTAAPVVERQPADCNILVADDDKGILLLATGILRRHGFKVHEASNGLQTLEMARTLLPDLVILDVNMPLLNGLEVLRALRIQPATAAVKVLLFTASDRQEEVELAAGLGANAYLRKPFRPNEFMRRIREMFPTLLEGSA